MTNRVVSRRLENYLLAMKPLISHWHDPQLVSALHALPTAATVSQPLLIADTISFAPTPKQEHTMTPLDTFGEKRNQMLPPSFFYTM
jgi:hypothetical protein